MSPVGRGSFTFSTGKWTTVSQRVKLNDVGSANGEQQLWVDGVSILNLSGLQIAVKGDTKFYGIMAQTFFVSDLCHRSDSIVHPSRSVNPVHRYLTCLTAPKSSADKSRADTILRGRHLGTRAPTSRTGRWLFLLEGVATYGWRFSIGITGYIIMHWLHGRLICLDRFLLKRRSNPADLCGYRCSGYHSEGVKAGARWPRFKSDLLTSYLPSFADELLTLLCWTSFLFLRCDAFDMTCDIVQADRLLLLCASH
jgi:hypothetical protein